MSISSLIIPAIIPQSYADLVDRVAKIIGVPEVHVDVVDGLFVPSTSWPYRENSDVRQAHDLLAHFSLEVDLMVTKPLDAAQSWLIAGADQLVFHIETISVEALAAFAATCPVTIGVSLSSGTPLTALYPYLPYVDYVQCMGIARIGSQGQPFDESVISRIAEVHAQYPELPISVDGSVNATTIPRLVVPGVTRLIVGSAIMSAPEPNQAYRTLTALALSSQGRP